MSISESHPLRGQLVDVRRGDLATHRVVTLDIAITEIISVKDENIWLLFRSFGSGMQRAKRSKKQSSKDGKTEFHRALVFTGRLRPEAFD